MHRCAQPLIKSAVWLSLLFVLQSCVLISKQYRYGYIAFNGEDVYNTGTSVSIPENAPSISQRYQPVMVGKSGDAIEKGHEGIDIIAKRGTPIIAPANGLVERSFWGPMYGNQLQIGHGTDAKGRHIKTRYFHLGKRLVKKGAEITRGQQIGTLGGSGVLAPNPHLHFETQLLLKDGLIQKLKPLNPHFFWFDGIGKVTCYSADKKWTTSELRLTYPVPCKSTPLTKPKE
ncbi:MAG: murein DD-endopeptidase MepM/ murein hydrolase activator NlpD [Parasphingorhabdus sp.]|jgi:murein DD-endopeptidase MepM/ murein hydrolase activator NlpD